VPGETAREKYPLSFNVPQNTCPITSQNKAYPTAYKQIFDRNITKEEH
jgi:hypothetical protein